jgi:hypothetical protein
MQINLGKISKIELNNGSPLLAKRNGSTFLFSPRFEELLVVIFVVEIAKRSPDSQDMVRDSSQRFRVSKSFRKIGKKNFLAIYYIMKYLQKIADC